MTHSRNRPLKNENFSEMQFCGFSVYEKRSGLPAQLGLVELVPGALRFGTCGNQVAFLAQLSRFRRVVLSPAPATARSAPHRDCKAITRCPIFVPVGP
jgi:hypothetical protein